MIAKIYGTLLTPALSSRVESRKLKGARRGSQTVCKLLSPRLSGRSLGFGFALMVFLATAPGALAKLDVVATTSDFGAIAEAIGGDHVTVTTLAKALEDPHFVDPKPSHIVKMNRADALIEGGVELEAGWLPPLVEGARNPKLAVGEPGRIQIGAYVELLEKPSSLDRTAGDIHALGNPHFMMDPQNGLIAARVIAASFCKLDPENCETYSDNLRSFQNRLEAKISEWKDALAPHSGKRLAAYHNTWPYFAKRFDLRVDLFLEPKPGIPPSPSHLAKVISEMRRDEVKVVIREPYQHERTADSVAGSAGARAVLVAQYPGGLEQKDTGYIELMDELVRRLKKALEDGVQ